MGYQPIVEKLITLIKNETGWQQKFDEAVELARESGVEEMEKIKTTEDYLKYIDDLVRWVPRENSQGNEVLHKLCLFYFVLDQPPLMELQTPIIPAARPPESTPLSAWMVDYAKAMGQFLDTPGSLTKESLETFRNSPNYNLDEYIEPSGGWKTFNEFFARKFKPGHRPVAAPSDPRVIVSPADSTFDGQWEIRPDSHVTLKGLHWQVSELMVDSKYSGRFTTGHFMHAFLSPTDYHRQHAPLAGKVLEARVIPGQVYLEVAVDTPGTPGTAGAPSGKRLKAFRTLDAPGGSIYAPGSSIYAPGSDINAPDNPGYQFAQARGLIVLETEIGLVAVLPIGMAQVSSVKLSVKPGQKVNKGDEISYFQFGGSDIVLLFEAKSNVNLTAQVGVHYKMGTVLGSAFPAS